MARIWQSPFVRLAGYYILLGLAVVLLLALFPPLRDLFARAQELSSIHGVSKSKAIEEAATAPGIGSLGFQALGLLTALSMLGALVLALPTAWVYMVTKQHRGYDQSVVQTVIVLPMTIAGTLILVQNSLALAFALGGIVAAIRFRNTLKDTKDVVYVYLALGVGMSAGVFVPVVSAAMWLVFNYALLTLWHFNVGNIYAHQTLTGRLQLGQAIVAPNAKTGEYQVIGNPELLRALAPERFEKGSAASLRRRGPPPAATATALGLTWCSLGRRGWRPPRRRGRARSCRRRAPLRSPRDPSIGRGGCIRFCSAGTIEICGPRPSKWRCSTSQRSLVV